MRKASLDLKMLPSTTLYNVLGVAPHATSQEIDAAHAMRREAAQGNADDLALLAVAHDTLGNPARRAAYDRTLQRLQATSTQTSAAIPANEQRHRRPGVWISALLLVMAAAMAVLSFGKRSPTPASPLAARSAAATGGTAAERESPIVARAETPAVEPEPATTAPMPPPEPAAPPVERESLVTQAIVVAPARGTKQAGFDAHYLAWSVFHVNQRNKRGSGVLIAADRILTNCHVLAGGATNGLVVIHSVTGRTSKVEKYAHLDDEDACLLLAPGAGNDAITWGDSAQLTAGDTLHTFGHPGGSPNLNWSTGRLIDRIRHKGETFLFSTNVCVPGSSGGPVLDDNGRLVGIVMGTLYFKSKTGEAPRYRDCIAVTEETARALLRRPLFPIALAPAQFLR